PAKPKDQVAARQDARASENVREEPVLTKPAAVDEEPALTKRAPRARRWPWILVVVVIVAAAAGWFWFGRSSEEQVKARGKGDPNARPMPVVAAPARKGEIDVFIDALGTVVPRNMVVVRSRVDGQLLSVAFREGQDVKAGDLLAQIDPRPFEVQ